MKTENLKELRELRIQEKAIKARIDEISGDAAQEAVDILAAEGRDNGEFQTPDGDTFQLQRTEVYDFTNYNRYKSEEATNWREKNKAKEASKKYQAALTKEMKGIVDGFVALHPDWEPDEIKLTVKVVEN